MAPVGMEALRRLFLLHGVEPLRMLLRENRRTRFVGFSTTASLCQVECLQFRDGKVYFRGGCVTQPYFLPFLDFLRFFFLGS